MLVSFRRMYLPGYRVRTSLTQIDIWASNKEGMQQAREASENFGQLGQPIRQAESLMIPCLGIVG